MRTLLAFIIAFYFVSAHGATSLIEFSLIPPKTIPAGQSALMILPVRILDNKCEYDISTKGNYNYPVQAPIELVANENSIQYLPFSVAIPATATNGQIYDLKVTFTPRSMCESQEAVVHNLTVEVQAYNSLSYEVGAEKSTTNKVATNFDLLLRNSGNTPLELNLQIENLTPSVRITAFPNSLTLAPREAKKAQIFVDFSATGADFASFKVIATSKGQKFLSKNYQIRLIKGSNTNSDGRQLNSQFYVTNEFISQDNGRNNYTTSGASINGEMSDYVALSAFIQSSYLQAEHEYTQYELDINNYENFRVTLGSSLNPTGTNAVGVTQLSGMRASKRFFEDMNVGVYGGVDYKDEGHVGTFADWTRGYEQRWLVYWDKNTKTNADSYGVSGVEHIRVNDKLAIAPSLILARDEIRGDYSRIGATLNSIITKNAPLTMDVFREEDNSYILERINSVVVIPFKSTSISLGASTDRIKSKVSELNSANGVYNEVYMRVLFPITVFIQGQATVKYQTTPDGRDGFAPELLFSLNKDHWQGYLRVGRQITRGSNEIILTGVGSGAEKYAQLDLNYKPYDRIGFYGNANIVKEENSSYYRYDTSFGVQKMLNGKEGNYVRFGLGTGKENTAFGAHTTDRAEIGYYNRFKDNWTFSANAGVNRSRELKSNDYSVGVTLTYTPQIPVSRKVEDAFGGRSSAELQGIVCFDLNNNGTCDPTDIPIKGVELRLGALSQVTGDNGEYLFYKVEPKDYDLIVRRATLPAEAQLEKDPFVLLNKNDRKTKDIALKWVGSVKVVAYEDKNGDGIWQKESEKQLPNIKVELTGNGVKVSDKTTSFRPTVFNGLLKGTYKVSITESLPGSEVVQENGVEIAVPNNKSDWVYLGVTFKDGINQLGDDVITTLSDSVIFKNDMSVSFAIEDMNNHVGSLKLYCGQQLISDMTSGLDKESSFIWEVNVKECGKFLKKGLLNLDLDLYLKGSKEVIRRKFEVIVR